MPANVGIGVHNEGMGTTPVFHRVRIEQVLDPWVSLTREVRCMGTEGSQHTHTRVTFEMTDRCRSKGGESEVGLCADKTERSKSAS